MRRSIVTAIAALTVALGAGTVGAAPAGAQPAGCAPSDWGCALVEQLEGSLAPPTTAPAPSSTSTAPSTTSSAPTAEVPALGDGPVAASAGAATPAELAAEASRVPSVPVGLRLELPPLTIPDFGRPAAAAAAPRVPVALPLRSEVGDALTGLPTPPAPEGGAPLAPLVAVGLPLLLVAVSLVARRARRDLPAPA